MSTDNPVVLKPCPFCGEIPLGGQLIACENTKCAIWEVTFTPLAWNRRASGACVVAPKDSGAASVTSDRTASLSGDAAVAEREAFEAWHCDQWGAFPKRDAEGRYESHTAQVEWIGWQARAALSSTAPPSGAWRDIASAPKSTYILAWAKQGFAQIISTAEQPGAYGYTHWMPLPSPPTEARTLRTDATNSGDGGETKSVVATHLEGRGP